MNAALPELPEEPKHVVDCGSFHSDSRWMCDCSYPLRLKDYLNDIRAYVAKVTVERDGLRSVCASAYQLAGLVDAPVRFLDVFGDAANGELGKRCDPDTLLPVYLAECDEIVMRNELLRVAACPTCDGGGSIMQRVAEDEFEAAQCQWCFGRNGLLTEFAPAADTDEEQK